MKSKIKLLISGVLMPIATLPLIVTACSKENTNINMYYDSGLNIYIPLECRSKTLYGDLETISLEKGTHIFTVLIDQRIIQGGKFYLLKDTGAKASFKTVEVIWMHKDEGQSVDENITDKWQYDSEKNILSFIDKEYSINYGTLIIKVNTEEDLKCIPTLSV